MIGAGAIGAAALGAAAMGAGAAGIGAAVLLSGSRDKSTSPVPRLALGDTKSLGNTDLDLDHVNLLPTTAERCKTEQIQVQDVQSSSAHDPVNDSGKEVSRDMAGVYVS